MAKSNKSKTYFVPIIALIVLAAVAGGIYYLFSPADSNDNDAVTTSQQQTGTPPPQPSSEKSPAEEYLETYTGDDFDRYFMANMIAHHQGAVDMAKIALTNAKHEELKSMANDIVSAQTSEMDKMIAWQKAWGYPSSSGEMMEDHSAMGMMEDMATMMQDLQGKTGDDFDKKFIELMIQHHGSAINMAQPGAKNAKHQEIKDLTNAVITAQTREISQMQSWWKSWGY